MTLKGVRPRLQVSGTEQDTNRYVLVCHPRKIPLLKQGNKSDKVDARKLAERLRLHDLKRKAV